jgi:hypothetical protein
VINVAKHYRWSVGVHLPFSDGDFKVPDDIDFSIVPAGSAADTMGLDITQPLWEQGADGLSVGENGFYYLSIPTDIQPELVLDTLSSLKN